MTPSVLRLTFAIAACAAVTGCARSYHPEYDPRTAYSYVQNVTYARNAWNVAPGAWADVNATVRAAVAQGDSSDGPCSGGGALACYGECFHEGKADACRRLGVMFDGGERVFQSRPTAVRLYAMACAMGDCRSSKPPGTLPDGVVSSPGSLVVYGNLYGKVVIGQ